MEVSLDELIADEQPGAADVAAQGRADADRQRTVSIAVLVGGLLLAARAGLFVACTTTMVTRMVSDVADALARGDLTKAVGPDSKCEFGDMGRALDTAVDELSRMASDLRTTVGRFTY